MHFLSKNQLQLLIRSHERKEQGYQVHHNGRCLTVFSAPNYCGTKNTAALIRFCSDRDNGEKSAETKDRQQSDPAACKLELRQFKAKLRKENAKGVMFW